MKTIAIGLRNFRRDLSRYIRHLKLGQVKFIVLHHNVPIMEVRPVQAEDGVLDNFIEEVSEARRQIANGDSFVFSYVCNLFGHDPETLRNLIFTQRA